MSVLDIAQRTKKIKPKICDFSEEPSPFFWMEELPGNNGCKLNCPKCTWCTYDFCHRHGQYQRIVDRNKIGTRPDERWKSYSVVQNFGVEFPAGVAREAIKFLREQYRYHLPKGWDWLYRWEWKQNEIHLNQTILCSTKCGKNEILVIGHRLFLQMGLELRSKSRMYVVETRNWEKWHDYMFKVKQILPQNQCPPKKITTRWTYWGWTKGFPRSS